MLIIKLLLFLEKTFGKKRYKRINICSIQENSMATFDDVDFTNSYPWRFIIKNGSIIIADNESTISTWCAILRAVWNSMELKRIIFNTTFNLIEKENIGLSDHIYRRGDITIPFTMKNINDTFKSEILHLINVNEYTIDITIKWCDDNDKIVHYKNF